MRFTLVLGSSLVSLIAIAGCRNSSTDDNSGSGGEASTSAKAASGSGSGTGTGGTGGSSPTCTGEDHTIADITSGTVGTGTKATIRGVVAMSQKFNVSHSTHCLWGVMVSAPNLTETGENTGILAVSYGTDPTIPAGESTKRCPKLGIEPAGDQFPDNVKPGDVLDITGQTDYFALTCGAGDPPNAVKMRQLSQVCSVVASGATAPLPAAHVLTGDELTGITSLTDTAFHDKWGGVKVRLANPTVQLQAGKVVGAYGIVKFQTDIPVADKIYYRQGSSNICSSGPVFANAATTFDYVEGFSYLDFCSWSLEANDKCADFGPSSDDCDGMTTCPPDNIGD